MMRMHEKVKVGSKKNCSSMHRWLASCNNNQTTGRSSLPHMFSSTIDTFYILHLQIYLESKKTRESVVNGCRYVLRWRDEDTTTPARKHRAILLIDVDGSTALFWILFGAIFYSTLLLPAALLTVLT